MRIKEQITDGTDYFYRFLAYRRYHIIYMFIIIYLRVDTGHQALDSLVEVIEGPLLVTCRLLRVVKIGT